MRRGRVLARRGKLYQGGRMPVSGPRELLIDPSRFGYRDAEWLDSPRDPQARAELAAGFHIHQAVLALRRTLAEHGLTQNELAERIGVNADTLGRKMRGEAWASLKDLMAWALELGIDLLPVHDSREDLLPKVGRQSG